ncbi:hypothetical protein K8R43_02100 [archaeon]|nr:hypothetical protein [archaeon]
MKEDNFRMKLAEIDSKLDMLKQQIGKTHAVKSEVLPPRMITKTSFEEIEPLQLKSRVFTLEDVLENLEMNAQAIEQTKFFEEQGAALDFYNVLESNKGTHPDFFNEPEFAIIMERFDLLPENRKEQLEHDIKKIERIAKGRNYSPLVLEDTLDQTIRKLEEIPNPTVRNIPETGTTIQEELKKEWLSEGILTKNFLQELQTKRSTIDIGAEVIDFYTRKKLSSHMIETLPIPKQPKPLLKRKPTIKRKRKIRETRRKKK